MAPKPHTPDTPDLAHACYSFHVIDLANTFDTIDHGTLISKFKHYGISDKSLLWFKKYFSERKQFVCMDSQTSEELNITSGVPQGSMLDHLC